MTSRRMLDYLHVFIEILVADIFLACTQILLAYHFPKSIVGKLFLRDGLERLPMSSCFDVIEVIRVLYRLLLGSLF